MHAVMKTGGKQYRVAPGDIVKIEKCHAKIGDKVEFQSVLLFQDDQGVTLDSAGLQNAKVIGEVLRQDRDKKVLVFKKKRRKNYRRTQGHRQPFTQLKIVDIIYK